MSEIGKSRHIFKRQTDREGSEITLARILDKNFYSTNVFDQFLVQMSRCVGMGEHNHSAVGRHLGLFGRCPSTRVSKLMASLLMAFTASSWKVPGDAAEAFPMSMAADVPRGQSYSHLSLSLTKDRNKFVFKY